MRATYAVTAEAAVRKRAHFDEGAALAVGEDRRVERECERPPQPSLYACIRGRLGYALTNVDDADVLEQRVAAQRLHCHLIHNQMRREPGHEHAWRGHGALGYQLSVALLQAAGRAASLSLSP